LRRGVTVVRTLARDEPSVSPSLWVLGIFLASLLGVTPRLRAQQAPQPQLAVPGQTQSQTATAALAPVTQPAVDPTVPKDDRILWTLPNYLTVENATSLPPMTPAGKLKLIARDTFDPVTFGFIGVEAGLNQASNTNPTFGQGLKGYAKRYGLAFADNGIGNFLTSGVFPIVLHQDPRFYQMSSGNFVHRFWYAGTRILVTRSDAGTTQLNYSEFLGNALAAGISNAYHPGPRTLRSNADIWVTQMAWDAISYEMKEFWPDLHHMVSHQH
jgi:hypothetical protein